MFMLMVKMYMMNMGCIIENKNGYPMNNKKN